jgi:hypothetical protein
MSAAYDGAAKLDTIGGFVCICEGGRSSTDVDDGGARFEESEGLGGLIARLGNDEHYPYEGICQDGAVGVISVHSSKRTRSGGVHVRVGRMWIRGFVGRDGGHHSKELNVVVHGERRKRNVELEIERVGRGKRSRGSPGLSLHRPLYLGVSIRGHIGHAFSSLSPPPCPRSKNQYA